MKEAVRKKSWPAKKVVKMGGKGGSEGNNTGPCSNLHSPRVSKYAPTVHLSTTIQRQKKKTFSRNEIGYGMVRSTICKQKKKEKKEALN